MTDINKLIQELAEKNQKSTQHIVGILGLGLIGGSFAKAYHAAGWKVFAYDTDDTMLRFAQLSGAVNEPLTRELLPACDLILLCAYPQASIDFLEEEGPYIGTHPLVLDCCGTKRVLVNAGKSAAAKYGFTYVGGHPMAGTQFSGFKHARKDMYKGAPMVIVPPSFDDIELMMRVKELLAPAGFKDITVTTAEKHDEMIAFTSQLAHVVSNAYVKSPTARSHAGFSAGSYKDLTRVAWLNPEMWTELFLENRDYLMTEIECLIGHLEEYKKALAANDSETLCQLLADGKRLKEEIDG